MLGLAGMLLLAACGGSTGVATPDAVELVSGSYNLTGFVTEQDGAGMRPSRGAHVVLEHGGKRQTADSDDDGGFSVSGLDAGLWQVTVTKRGYAPDTRGIQLRADAKLVFWLYHEAREPQRPRPY
jgi:hypothetical protein